MLYVKTLRLIFKQPICVYFLVYTLNIWRPSAELRSVLREGCRYKAYHLATSETKKHSGTSNIQFTATKKTQFKDIEVKLGAGEVTLILVF